MAYVQQFDEDTPQHVQEELTHEEKLRLKWHETKYDNTSYYSRFFLSWMEPLTALGRSYNLIMEDVPRTHPLCQTDATLPLINSHFQSVFLEKEKNNNNTNNNGKNNNINDNHITPLSTKNRVRNYQEYLTVHQKQLNEQKQKRSNNKVNHNKMKTDDELYSNHPAMYTSNDDYDDNLNRKAKEPVISTWPILHFFWMFRHTFYRSLFGDSMYYAMGLIQPFCIKLLSQHLQEPDSSLLDGLVLVLFLTLISSLSMIAILYKSQNQTIFSARVSSAILSAIFEKTLRIAPWAVANDEKLATVQNLVSTDANSVMGFSFFMNLLITGPITIIACLVLMAFEFGFAVTIVSVILMILLIPMQSGLASISAYYRRRMLLCSDKRLKLTTQFLNSLRVIKAYGLELIFEQKVTDLRELELRELWWWTLWMWITEILGAIFPLVVTFGAVATYVWANETSFDPTVTFVILSYLSICRVPINFLPYCFSTLIEFKIGCERIALYLSKEELPVREHKLKQIYQNIQYKEQGIQQQKQQEEEESKTSNDSIITFNNVDLYFSSFEQTPQQVPCLTNVTLDIKYGDVLAIIGASGQGKSAFLLGIIGEMYPQYYHDFSGLLNIPNLPFIDDDNNDNGEQEQQQQDSERKVAQERIILPTVHNNDCLFSLNNNIDIIPQDLIHVRGRIGYCPQHNQPLFNDTIRANIILQQPYHRDHFLLAIEASGLLSDLLTFGDDADLTLISAGGASLSGGQRSRIVFASVLYHALQDAIDIILLDDIFAAVDNDIAKVMFFKGVFTILHCQLKKTIIMTLNSHYSFLMYTNKIIILDTIKNDPFYYNLHQYLIKHNRGQYQQGNSNNNNNNNRDNHKVNDEKQTIVNKTKQQLNSDDYYNDADVTNANNNNNNNNTSIDNNIMMVVSDGLQPSTSFDQMLRSQSVLSKVSLTHSIAPTNMTNINKQITSAFGFRQPTGIVWTGNYHDLIQYNPPLLQSYTLSKTTNDEQLYSKISTYDELLSNKKYSTIGIINEEKERQQHLKTLHKIETGKEKEQHDNKNTANNNSNNNGDNENAVIDINNVNDENESSATADNSNNNNNNKQTSSSPSQANVGLDLYVYWFRGTRGVVGCWVVIATLFFLLATAIGSRVWVDYWLVEWANELQAYYLDPTNAIRHSNTWWNVTTIIGIVVATVLFSIQIVLFCWTQLDASRSIHQFLIHQLFRCDITTYLDVTPMGSIISLITRDVYALDVPLGDNLIYFLQQAFVQLGTMGLSLIASPFFLIPTIPVGYFIWLVYLSFYNSSVQLRRLEVASLAPINGVFNALQRTSSVIRCFQYEYNFIKQFKTNVDQLINTRMLAMWLEGKFCYDVNMICTLYMALLTLGVVLFRSYINPTLGMLTISYALRTMSTTNTVLRMFTSASREMTSIQRIHNLQYIPLEPELYSTPQQLQQLESKQPQQFKQLYNYYTNNIYLKNKISYQTFIQNKNDKYKNLLKILNSYKNKLKYYQIYQFIFKLLNVSSPTSKYNIEQIKQQIMDEINNNKQKNKKTSQQISHDDIKSLDDDLNYYPVVDDNNNKTQQEQKAQNQNMDQDNMSSLNKTDGDGTVDNVIEYLIDALNNDKSDTPQKNKTQNGNNNGDDYFFKQYITKDQNVLDLYHREDALQNIKYWPWFGGIEFRNVSIKYRKELPIVLNNVSFKILPKQSVGICAASGSGKSTLLLSLFKMVKPHSGEILIDGVNIQDIGLADMRSRLALIPQFPTLYSATVRENVDICYRYTDAEVWKVLKLVNLDKVIKENGGLYSEVQENGMNFSASERQLICIARALLTQIHSIDTEEQQQDNTTNNNNNNNNDDGYHQQQQQDINKGNNDFGYASTTRLIHPQPNDMNMMNNNNNVYNKYNNLAMKSLPLGSILFGDELSSFTDSQTDNFIQSTILKTFKNSTKLIIAHRIASIINNHRVLVLKRLTQDDIIIRNESSVAEFDAPWVLLNNPNTLFYSMCLAGGIESFVSLYQQAEKSFNIIKCQEFEWYGKILVQDPPTLIDIEALKEEYKQRDLSHKHNQQQQIQQNKQQIQQSDDNNNNNINQLSLSTTTTTTTTELVDNNNNMINNQYGDLTDLKSPDPFAPTNEHF